MAAEIGQPQNLTAVDQFAGPYNIGDTTGDVVFQVYGTFVGTITFEGKVLGVPDVAANWVVVQAIPLGTGTAATTTTGPGIFRVNASGIQVRARMSAFTSGTASVVADVVDQN